MNGEEKESMRKSLQIREMRLQVPRGTYKAQQLLACEKAEEFAEASRNMKRSELYLLYVYALKALSHAKSICFMSRTKKSVPANDFVLQSAYLIEYCQRLKDYPNLIFLLKQWPKNPGITLAWFAGRSALEVIMEFAQRIRAAVEFARGEVACHGEPSYDNLQVSPECDSRFAEWQERTIKELCEKTIPKPDVWPSPADIHKECKQVLLKLEDEYNKSDKEVKSNYRNVFYSWQSDMPNKTNRGFIQKALENAAKAIRNDDSIKVEPVIDRDTQDVPGSPDIPSVIFSKIEESAVFVCDVSIINKRSKFRKTANPNVLVELGYAMKTLGAERILMVMNTAFGKPELLPFDLKKKRVVSYYMPEKSKNRANERKVLESKLKKGLQTILSGDLSKKNGPEIEDAKVSVCIRHSHGRDCCGDFIVINSGSEPCDITDIKITSSVPLPKLNLVSFKSSPTRGKVREIDQKLPLAIPRGRTRVFFRTEEVTELYIDSLPESLVIDVRFNKSESVKKTLDKTDAHHYS